MASKYDTNDANATTTNHGTNAKGFLTVTSSTVARFYGFYRETL